MRTLNALRVVGHWQSVARSLARTMGVVCALSLWAAPGSAASISLASAVSGTPLVSDSGILTFSGFAATPTGTLSSDLSSYELTSTESGFDLVGPFSASAGEVGAMTISFEVASSQPITFASLSFNGQAVGLGAEASVSANSAELNSNLYVFATGGGARQLSTGVALGGQTTLAVVLDGILVDSSLLSGGPTGLATITNVSQTFQTVPEAGSGALIVFALALLRASQGRGN